MPREKGWYQDLAGRNPRRYFDGERWIEPGADRKRRRSLIDNMAKDAEYRKPLREGQFVGSGKARGGSWNEYKEVAVSALLLETLQDIDARLEQLVGLMEKQANSDV